MCRSAIVSARNVLVSHLHSQHFGGVSMERLKAWVSIFTATCDQLIDFLPLLLCCGLGLLSRSGTGAFSERVQSLQTPDCCH
jgi:hypothetical protein